MNLKHKEETPAGGLHNVLSSGSAIKGNVIADTDFRLDGKVEGDIHCGGKIVIGPKGSVLGNVTAENAEIMGEIAGCVNVNGKLVLKSTARIEGDICIRSIEIEPNARFNGKCIMSCEE
ncbi:hypothetical protein A9168_00760 [Macellibacteroides sp. HH-ZS]|nr:hypothetical protein A9168_00760 [Macellibacteroides sp. HH-ZS]